MSKEETSLPKEVLLYPNGVWTLEFYGSHSSASFGAGVVLIAPRGKVHPLSFKLQFENTKNTTEYEALILGLRMEKEMGVKNLLAHGDAEII
ncbi:hypothetical protein KI387_032912, partial [Taxus chinensis]